ncbi:MAG: hypothetical protein WCJ13_11975 [Coriobacteriia bacterium]
MTKEIAKNETALTKKFSIQEAKDIVLLSTKHQFGVESKLKELAEIQLPQLREGKIKDTDLSVNITKISRALSLDSGHALAESVDNDYHELALQVKDDFHKEFDCKTSSEKALVDLAVSSYISKLHYSKLLRLNQKTSSSDYNGFRNSASKEIDRAHRQFISAIEMLRMIKQPALRVNIKTNNAFVGENQQFNNIKE